MWRDTQLNLSSLILKGFVCLVKVYTKKGFLLEYDDYYAMLVPWGMVPPTILGFERCINMWKNGLASEQEDVLRKEI